MSEKEKIEAATRIEAIMQEKGEVTLKALAMVFNLPPQRIYSTAKQPKEGVVYDAKVYNWEAIERFLNRRLGQEGMPTTLEEVVERALEIDAQLKEADGRKSANRGTVAGEKIEVDGKMIPKRKYTNFEMLDEEGNETGNMIVLKKDPHVYKMVYQTRSHTVLVPVSDVNGTVAGDLVKVITNGMLNMKGFGPAGTAQGIEMRFSGEFAEKFPQYMPGYQEEFEAKTETPTAE